MKKSKKSNKEKEILENLPREHSRTANQVILLILSFFLLSVIASTRKIGWPVWEMLTGYNDVFGDFNGDRFENTRTYFHMTPEYGVLAPGGVWIGYFFSFFTLPLAVWLFQLLAIGSTILSIQFLLAKQSISKPFVLVVCSFPFLFAYFRGNNDIWQFPALAIFVALIVKGKFAIASICLGLISSVEPYNSVFAIVIAIFGLRYLFVVLGTGLIVFSSLIFIGAKDLLLYIENFRYTSNWYADGYILGNGGFLANNSLWGLGKFLLFEIFDSRSQGDINAIYPFFAFISLIGILLSVLIVFLARSRSIDVLFNSFIFLSVAIVIFAPTSATYKLVILLVDLLVLLFLMGDTSSRKVIWLLVVAILPKNWIWFRWPEWELGCTLDTVVNPILLSVAWCMLAWSLAAELTKKLVRRET